MTTMGSCQLCDQRRSLQNSHYLSKLLYKRYVADQSRGGQFTDLLNAKRHNRQETPYLFCEECEQEFAETYAAGFLDRIDANPTVPQAYDGPLLRFAVSLSWRLALYNMHNMPRDNYQSARDQLRGPCKRWKSFLKSGTDILPYSQHAFIDHIVPIPGTGTYSHQTIGGQPFFLDSRLLLVRAGPLIVVALLDRAHLTQDERRIWSLSEISQDGGKVWPLNRDRPQIELTDALVQVLNWQEAQCLQRRHEVT